MIRFACPSCEKIYTVPPSSAGKSATCKDCAGRFVIPEWNEEASPSSPVPPPSVEPSPSKPLVKVLRANTPAKAEPKAESKPENDDAESYKLTPRKRAEIEEEEDRDREERRRIRKRNSKRKKRDDGDEFEDARFRFSNVGKMKLGLFAFVLMLFLISAVCGGLSRIGNGDSPTNKARFQR